jgi:hypothetical protein
MFFYCWYVRCSRTRNHSCINAYVLNIEHGIIRFCKNFVHCPFSGLYVTYITLSKLDVSIVSYKRDPLQFGRLERASLSHWPMKEEMHIWLYCSVKFVIYVQLQLTFTLLLFSINNATCFSLIAHLQVYTCALKEIAVILFCYNCLGLFCYHAVAMHVFGLLYFVLFYFILNLYQQERTKGN